MPSCQLILEKLVFIDVHINFDGKIQPKTSILPLLTTPIINTLKYTLPLSALSWFFYTILSSRSFYSQTMEKLEYTTALFKTEGITF